MNTGNLSSTERTVSALAGAFLGIVSLTRGGPIMRIATAASAGALLLRALSGNCAVKAALMDHRPLAHRIRERAVDETVEQSFPASDPPGSRLPDEPPSNAEAKWEAARAAGQA
jgi:hypothetical protein